MNDPVIERVAREDPARDAGGTDGGAERGREARARVLAAIDRGAASRPPRSRRRRPPRRREGALVTGIAILVAAAIAVAFAALGHHVRRPVAGGGASAGPPPGPPAEIAVGVDAAGVVNVGDSPQALLAHDGFLWVATPRSVVELELGSGRTVARIPIPTAGVEAGLAFGAGSLWVAPTGGSELLRIDPRTGRLIARVGLGGGRSRPSGGGVAFADGMVWVSRDSSRPRGDVIAVDPATDAPDGRAVTVGSGPGTIASGSGSLWVENTSDVVGSRLPATTYPDVSRIDPRTRAVAGERFSGVPAVGLGALWVVTDPGSQDTALIRVDPLTGRPALRIAVPRAIAVAFGAGRVWAVSEPRSGSAGTFRPIAGTAALTQIDPVTGRVLGSPVRLRLLQPVAIAISRRQLWIADYGSATLTHYRLTGR